MRAATATNWWVDGPSLGPCSGCDGWMHPVGNRTKFGKPAVMYECDTCWNETTISVTHLQRLALGSGS